MEDELAGLSEYQKNALDFCRTKGIISGYEDGSIRPYNSITRAEFASMTARLFGLLTNDNCTFDDAANHWASKYIEACVKEGAISGMGDNKFAPDSNVTYEQAMKILTVMCKLTDGLDLDAMGGYPTAYMTVGKNNELDTGLSENGLTPSINRINVAVLFYNSQQ